MKNKALEDSILSIEKWRVWLYLAWHGIRSRYQRTVLGPIWLVLSMAVTIAGVGTVWSFLFKMELKGFFPYFAAGMISWNLLTAIVTGSTDMFIKHAGMIKSTATPKFIYIYTFVSEQFIIFFHNMTIYLVVAIIFQVKVTIYTFLFPVVLVIFFLNAVGIAVLLGILGARFRDVTPIISSIMTLVFFITPVMWKPAQLGARSAYMILNPFYSYIVMIRNPLLGAPIPLINFIIVALCTMAILGIAAYFFNKYRSRIVYWV